MRFLEDLRDVAELVVDSAQANTAIDARFVCSLNAKITRSGALHPGQLRTAEQGIGVRTRYGRHEPAALTAAGLQALLSRTVRGEDPVEDALDLFVTLAAAQPFEDGNKRTALFAANSLLIRERTGKLLTIPVDEQDPRPAEAFNDLLARAYVHGETTGVKNLLRADGITRISDHTPTSAQGHPHRPRTGSAADTGPVAGPNRGATFGPTL